MGKGYLSNGHVHEVIYMCISYFFNAQTGQYISTDTYVDYARSKQEEFVNIAHYA
jgi:hypothetical protein